MKHSRLRFVAALVVCLFAASVALAQQKGAPKKSYVLNGKIEEIDQSGNRLTVNHEEIKGYMAAMTMPYKVDKPDVFQKVKVGDQIRATVYDGDYTLYNIEVVPPRGAKKK
jgi:protein SCO1/2